ncbi:periostin-like [Tachypleus tridentatus]|uniref:periostin-like n=1 Tax=Tachypleus tridentatus TaxID=6853 RepID=UPI003FCF5881
MPGLNVQGQPVGLTIFQDLLQQSGVDILKQRGPFTVLVPTDDAFSNLPSGVLNELRNNPQLLRHVLLNHIISLSLNPQDLQNNMVVETNSGLKLFVSVLNGGQKILIGGPSVIASTLAQNGYVFVINRVLYPLPKRDISVALKDRPNLSQLLSLVIKSGLENTLRGAGPYTVFAPTDEAFAALPENVLEKLLSNPGALKELILNHVVDSVHYKKEFTSGLILPTSRGQQLRFFVTSDGSVKVNNANIVEFDILTENGVIHSIDRVLFTQPSSQLGAGTTSFRPGTPPIGQPQHPSTHFRPGTPPPRSASTSVLSYSSRHTYSRSTANINIPCKPARWSKFFSTTSGDWRWFSSSYRKYD